MKMMKKAFLLQHSYMYGKRCEFEETKVLGIFTTQQEAEKAIDFYKKLPGFKDFDDNCFSIDMYILDNYEWQEGFEQESHNNLC